MKTATLALIASSVALASAQASYNSSTGKFTCAKPNVAYCAGDSLKTDIIIRCNDKGVGQPGRCSDNLAGEPPLGNKPSLCWSTSETSGDAACEKNCVVYGSSGNYNGTFTLPADQCSPTYTASSSGVTSKTASSSSAVKTSSAHLTTAPATTPTTTVAGGNGTHTSTSTGSTTASRSASRTASSSASATGTLVVTAAAPVNQVGGLLAVLGLAAAYLL